MFSLVKGFYDELTFVRERPIALLGVDSAGKSSLLEWMKIKFSIKSSSIDSPSSTILDKITSTVGLNVAKLKVKGERLLIWDLGGTKSLRSIWDRYISEAEAIIWVIDTSDPTRFQDSKECLHKVMSQSHLRHSPLLVFANKQDLENAIDPVKISLALDLLSDAEERPQCVQPCSAKTGKGITEGIDWLISSLQGESKIEMRIP